MGYREKGSFTVEAALIMPVILSIIVLFINAALVFYDRCVMEYVCQMACNAAVYDSEGENAAEEYIRQHLSEDLILKWDYSIRTEAGSDHIGAGIWASGPFFDRIYVHEAKACKHFCPKY